MGALHLIVPLEEVRNRGELAWLEAFNGSTEALSRSGRYPTWVELLAAASRLSTTKFEVHEAGLEAQLHLQRGEAWATLEVLRAHAEASSFPLISMSYRGWDVVLFPLLQDLEVVCGGPFLVIVNAESPRLVRSAP